MSYIDYLKAKEQEKKRNDIRPRIPDIVGYGRVKCDLCGRFSDVTDPNTELSTVTNASDGTKRFYHFCYKCLHKRMDIDDIHGFYTDDEVKRWRLKYKEAKTKKAANSYDDLCLNCFIKSNGIRIFTEFEVENEEWQEYIKTHSLYILLQTGADRYTNEDGSETTECHTSFTLTETNFHKPSTDLNICEGKNTSLCEKCRFRKKEERGEKPHNYLRFKCPTCGTEMIADANNGDCAILNGIEYTSCPVCGYTLRYDRHGKGHVSVEEYNIIKSQYEQKD